MTSRLEATLGVMIQELTPAPGQELRSERRERRTGGRCYCGQSSCEAEIEKGDVITELNGERVSDSRSLQVKIAGMSPGTSVRLKVLHDGRERGLTVTLGELPAELAPGAEGGGDKKGTTILCCC